MKRCLATVAIVLMPTAVFAQSQLERLEAVSEQTNEIMIVKMVEEMTAETGADPAPIMEMLPDMSWDAEFRSAGECMLEKYEEKIGRKGIDTMLDNMEEVVPTMAEKSIEEMGEDFDILPEGMTISDSISIQQDCGMMELAQKRMSESGFMEAMFSAATAAE